MGAEWSSSSKTPSPLGNRVAKTPSDTVTMVCSFRCRPAVAPWRGHVCRGVTEDAPRGCVPDQDKMLPCSPDANGRALACQPKRAGWVVAQIEPRAPYNDWLM